MVNGSCCFSKGYRLSLDRGGKRRKDNINNRLSKTCELACAVITGCSKGRGVLSTKGIIKLCTTPFEAQ